MKEFLEPDIKVNAVDEQKNYGRFVVDDLERGFGITLGNALRRVLLSSIPGSAVNGVTISTARHEYSTLEGVVEDPIMIILNLQELVVKIDEEEEGMDSTKTLLLEVVGVDPNGTEVTAKDIICPSNVHILNPDLVIAHVAPQGSLKMSITVVNGRGFVSADDNKKLYPYLNVVSNDAFPIPTDSSFSPIVKVNYSVEPCRVGHKADYDRLILEVWTNGAILPQDAVSLAARILMAHFEIFANITESTVSQDADSTVIFAKKQDEKKNESEDKPIEELDLKVRPYNCLKRASISTIGELTQKTEEEMMKVRNLGKKSLKEVKDKLLSLGLNFKNENN